MRLLKFTIELLKLKYIPLYLIAISIALTSFGKSVGLNYYVAPYFFILLILILFSAKNKRLSNVIKPLIWFLPIVIVSSVNFLYFTSPAVSYIQYVSYSCLIYLIATTFYYIINKDFPTLKITYFLFVLLYILAIYRYFRSEALRDMYDFAQHQNNAFYYVLMPLPIILLNRNNLIKNIAIIITFLICFLSLKRSAIIIISLITMAYFWFDVLKGKRGFLIALSFFALTFIIYALIDKSIILERYSRVTYRFEKLEYDKGSGRGEILKRFWEKDIVEVNKLPTIFIGKGYAATNNKYKELSSLHNDWAEVYYSFGIIGLLLLLWFFINLCKRVLTLYRSRNPMFIAYLTAFILFLSYSLIGGNFFFINTSLSLFAFLGISEAMIENKVYSI